MGLFSISEEENKYFNDNNKYIELVSCPTGETFCSEHLKFINERMSLSSTFWMNKNFPQAIAELKVAFYKTTEINSPSCSPCVGLFRSTIIKSLEVMQEDLRQMTTGHFKAKRHQSCYELVNSVLDELKQKTSNSETV
jgi:hypothetical protein